MGIDSQSVLSNETRQKIAQALMERGATLPCPRCGNSDFTLVDGYFGNSIMPDWKGIFLGGQQIPCAVLVCTKCGYLSQHALGVLDLMKDQETDNG